jgi:hypothetical protein
MVLRQCLALKEKLLFTMKNFKVLANDPNSQRPDFWTEDWLDVAIKELDTRRFTPEQYEQYAITLAKNAAVLEEEQCKIATARTEGEIKGKTKMIVPLYLKGVTIEVIAEVSNMTIQEVSRIIEQYENSNEQGKDY